MFAQLSQKCKNTFTFIVVGIDVAVNNTEEHAIRILSMLCYSVCHL